MRVNMVIYCVLRGIHWVSTIAYPWSCKSVEGSCVLYYQDGCLNHPSRPVDNHWRIERWHVQQSPNMMCTLPEAGQHWAYIHQQL